MRGERRRWNRARGYGMRQSWIALFLLAAILATSAPVQAASTAVWYVDVYHKNHLPHEVRPMWARNVTDGFGDCWGDGPCYFYPVASVTREQFFAFVARAFGLSPDWSAPVFPDYTQSTATRNDAWGSYYPWVQAAAKAGIVKGDGNGRFNPSDTVPRIWAIVALIRALELDWYAENLTTQEINAALSRFADGSSVPAAARPYAAAAIILGIWVGYPDGTLRPNDDLQRAQAVGILYRSASVRIELSSATVSPDGDGYQETVRITLRPMVYANPQSWTLWIENKSGVVVRQWSGTSLPWSVDWNGRNQQGQLLPPGEYIVKATMDDLFEGEIRTLQAAPKPLTLTLNFPPVAGFTWAPNIPQVGQTVSFTNTSSDPEGDPLTYRWEYRKPGSSTWTQFSSAKNPTLTVDAGGIWTIRLTVWDSKGRSDSITKSLTVNRVPVANFSWSPSIPQVGQAVSFTNTSSDPDGDPLTYRWEYQRPGSSTWVQFSTATNPSLTVDAGGTWAIRLTVQDNKGASAIVTKSLAVNRAPVANFSWSPAAPYTGDTITFTNTSSDSDGDALTYRWEYQRPGSTAWVVFAVARDPSLTLDADGTWSIRLTVWDGKGGTASVTKFFTVRPTWVSCIPAPNPVRVERNTIALLYCDPEAVNATVTGIQGLMPDGRVVNFAPMSGGALWRAVYDVRLNQGAYHVTYRVSGTSASGRPLQADVPVSLLVSMGGVLAPDPGMEVIGPQPGQPFKIRLTR